MRSQFFCSHTSKTRTNPRSSSRRLGRSRLLKLESLERRQLLAAEVLQVTIENLAVEGGLGATPVWIGAHDGTFDIGTLGESAAGFGGLQEIAEGGDVSVLRSRFASESSGDDDVVTAPDGFAGAPVFEPGESVTQNFTVSDTTASPYFSFASMVIPSNDAFIGNLNSQAYRLFDDAGNFRGTQTIVVYGDQIWDAGTEVNDPAGGPAFVPGAGARADENGVITAHLGLDDFVGVDIASGGTLGRAFEAQTPIARITISQASQPSNPIDTSAPTAVLQATDLNQRADFHEVEVVYRDPSGVDLSSITTGDLRVTGPLLTQLDVVSVTTDAPVGAVAGFAPTEVTATYRLSPSIVTSSGMFTSLDNGTYTVVLLDGEVNDPFAHSAAGENLGDFTVHVPVRLNVTFESLGDAGGLGQTPVWIAAHDGRFEIARAGGSAANFGGLEELAEDGDLSVLVNRFINESSGNGATITAPGGFVGAPVFEPGEVFSQSLDVDDPASSRFFSYASMVIPSNDAFIANLDPRAIELFDAFGQFTGTRTITLYGQDIWDAGTETNGPGLGAAFSTEGGVSVDEGGVIRRHVGLDDFVGTGLPTGESLGTAFSSMTPIGRITITMADSPASAIDHRGPRATADAPSLIGGSQPTHQVRVTYSDGSGVDVNSLDVNDIQITSADGRELQVVGVTTSPVGSESSHNVTAVYEVAPVDGDGFTPQDNGLYFISLNDAEVGDTLGNESPITAIGSFEVRVAVELDVTIENLSSDGGLAQTPFWIGVHEGNFEVGRAGASAADFEGLEAIAEEGNVDGLVARFASQSDGAGAVVAAPGGFAGAPVFEPGEIATQTVQVFDTDANRFFSFASMVIPSNDAFLANLNPQQYELFDVNGFFNGPRTITIYGRDIWDAGTEVNSVGAGAAFSTLPGDGVDENGVIRRHGGLDAFVGTPIASGGNLESAFTSLTPIARITIGLAGTGGGVVDLEGPVAAASVMDVDVAGTNSQTITVTYNDPAGIDLTTIGVDDINVTGPRGEELRVVDVEFDAANGTTPQSVVATYTITTHDDEFTARNNGRYVVAINSDSVRDTFGQGRRGEVIGAFGVDVGVRLEVSIESLSPLGGLSQTPFWVGFHEGSFEIARGGRSASEFPGLEQIAETGDVSELVNRFQSETSGTGAVLAAPGGFAGAPVIEPGETTSQIIEVTDSNDNRFFSFASMVIPSNDAFVANLNPAAYELFDINGNFKGARQITIYGRDVYDAGTEVNNAVGGGAAFSPGSGDGVDEGGVVHAHTGLDEFIGTDLPTGATLASAFGALTPLATITISLHDPEAEVCSGVDAACSVRSVSLQNSQTVSDVNRDGFVSSLDALLVINFLNEFGSRSTISDEAQRFGFDLDVGGDTQVTELDALIVINELNRRSAAAEPLGRDVNESGASINETFDVAISQLTRPNAAATSFGDDEIESAISQLF